MDLFPGMSNGSASLYTIPAIAALDWIPSFGNSQYSTDPASVAGKEIYGRVRAAYSGALDADAPDFIVYLGALDSLFAYIGYLKRMYRCLSVYTPENLALPDALLQAMGITPALATDFRRDKVRFWQGINELILQSRKFKCPAVMDLFNRHYWMSDNVYADAPSLRAQLYMFVLRGVYKIGQVDEVSSGDKVAGLVMTEIPRDFVALSAANSENDHYICDTLLEFGRDLITALDSWDDCYTISGYLQRAYDGVQNFSVAELLQNEVMVAQYVPEVLTQIENSQTVIPAAMADLDISTAFTKLTVSQNVLTNAVVSRTKLTYKITGDISAEYTCLADAFMNGLPIFISQRSDAPTVADTVIATRLKPAVQYDYYTTGTGQTASTTFDIDIYGGTEIPLRWNLYIWVPAATVPNDGSYLQLPVPPVALINFPNPKKLQELVTTIKPAFVGYWDQFDWHPITLMGTQSLTAATVDLVVPMGDVHNPTLVSKDMLTNLHKICFYSEMNSFGM